jgi:hypothetical protein
LKNKIKKNNNKNSIERGKIKDEFFKEKKGFDQAGQP